MSSVARLYKVSCVKKNRYPTRRAARRALCAIRRRYRGGGWHSLRVYNCVFCGGFHHGHGPGGNPLVEHLRKMGPEAAMALITKEAA